MAYFLISSRILILTAATSLIFLFGCVPVPSGKTVGGNATGLIDELTLTLNNTESLVVTQNGAYKFVGRLNQGANYEVTISSQTATQRCTLKNERGVVSSTHISNIDVNCVTALPVITHIWPSPVISGREVKVSGSNLDLAEVAFNGSALEPTLRTSHELRFITPEGPGGTYLLQLENDAGRIDRNVTQISVVVEDRLTHSKTPVTIAGVDTAISISGSGASYDPEGHTCALLASGEVKCWGLNKDGQLGGGFSSEFSTQPISVSGINGAVSIGAGRRHTCAVLNTGTVQCWGFDLFDQLGDGNNNPYNHSSTPVNVFGIYNAVSVGVGADHSCALLSNGTVQCWGFNRSGQLGNDSTVQSPVPVPVTGISDAVSISAGINHSCALLSTGRVKCWGLNDNGELGNGTVTASTTPVWVKGITDALTISAGDGHSCAVTRKGTIYCWGNNEWGKLGDGSVTTRVNPAMVLGITNAVSVDAGWFHTCALLSTGTVQCWGCNRVGELGNGTTSPVSTSNPTPTTVFGIDTAISITTGINYSCALFQNGQVQCWGTNLVGQLTLPAFGSLYLLEN